MEIKTLYHSKTTAAKNRSISYIVIHYTAGTTSKSGSAYNTANYFKTSSAEGSADYVVDDANVYLCNSDIKNAYSWAVGGSKYSSLTTSEGAKYYGKCTNKNSISIEICSNKTNTSSLLATDTDWYFTDNALSLAAELTKKLMSDYGISIDNVIMHHQVTGKVCPNPFCVNEARLAKWQSFKALVSESMSATSTSTTSSTSASASTSSIETAYFTGATTANLNVRKYAGTAYDVLGVISKGGSVKVIDKYIDGWYEINYNGALGYVSADYVTIDTTAANVTGAINKLADYGCIATKEYWLNNYANLKYLDSLILNMGLAVRKKATSKTITDFSAAVNTLVKKGVIKTAEYWLANVNKIEYLSGLVVNVANALI